MGMVTEAVKAKAEVCHGNEKCREKLGSWLSEIGLPNRLLSFQEIEECGYVKDTGFVWLKHKKKKASDREQHFRFDNVIVLFEDEVTAYFEPNKIKNLTGVKAKEFWIWISLTEIQVNRSSGWITFKTPAGLSKSFPLSVFEVCRVSQQGMMKQADHHDAKEGTQVAQQQFNRKTIYFY